jgi:hypothetical protein
VDIYRSGAVDMSGVNETTLRPARVWTRDTGAGISAFPEWGTPVLGAPPVMPPSGAPGGMPSSPDAKLTFHYSFNAQSLILNYLMGAEVTFPLGLRPDVFVNDFAIDPSGNTVIFCFTEYRAGRDRPNIRVVAQDISSSLPYWSEIYDGVSCALGLGSYAADGSTFAMSIERGVGARARHQLRAPWRSDAELLLQHAEQQRHPDDVHRPHCQHRRAGHA